MAEPLVEFRNVTLDYGGKIIVQHMNLKVFPGETKVILGPSGVGKSTILKAILGLLRPQSGKIYLHGKEISRLPERKLSLVRRRMAMVFQHGALFDSMTVAENVGFRLRELALADASAIAKRVREVLRFVGLENAASLRPAELSGGMRKRVAIARALAPDPEIFLFDEPTVGLDPVNFYNIEQLILKLKHQQRATMVIVTHDVGSACRTADSIAMLYEGRFIFEGPGQDLKREKDKRVRAFLDPSQAGLLVH
ncbi:MAG: ATP-binding cassette domain-containing protein [Candidatus Omnitrophica bacterium]|nr:ATP-binding cassette domain-containing protein [Candidatus Omnitrophota bacterium]